MIVKHIDFPTSEKFIGAGVTSATGYEVAIGAYTVGIKVVAVSTIDRSFTIAGSITEEGKALFPVSVASKKVAYTEHLFDASWQNQDVAKWYDETVAFLNTEFTKYISDTYLTAEEVKATPVVAEPVKEEVKVETIEVKEEVKPAEPVVVPEQKKLFGRK